jgi:hypothetical protein
MEFGEELEYELGLFEDIRGNSTLRVFLCFFCPFLKE